MFTRQWKRIGVQSLTPSDIKEAILIEGRDHKAEAELPIYQIITGSVTFVT